MLDGLPAFMPVSALAAMALALLLALLIDALWGEPPSWLHPVVAMGWYLACWRKVLLAQRPVLAFSAGATLWLIGAVIIGVLAWSVQYYLLHQLPAVLAALLLALALKPLLAWRMLQREVLAVEAALGQSLDAGRQQLARLVSRDVSALSETQVRESAIESLAENLTTR